MCGKNLQLIINSNTKPKSDFYVLVKGFYCYEFIRTKSYGLHVGKFLVERSRNATEHGGSTALSQVRDLYCYVVVSGPLLTTSNTMIGKETRPGAAN